ncbi:MAG TPA: EamA family transporter, partial [Thermoanaerobaculia bacterium]
MHRTLSRLALFAAVVVWGTTFVVVQRALHDLTVFHLIVYRFVLGTVLLLPVLGPWRALRDRRLLVDS